MHRAPESVAVHIARDACAPEEQCGRDHVEQSEHVGVEAEVPALAEREQAYDAREQRQPPAALLCEDGRGEDRGEGDRQGQQTDVPAMRRSERVGERENGGGERADEAGDG